MNLLLTDLESDAWEPIVGPTINPKDADAYQALNTPNGLVLTMLCSSDYGGWLAKHVAPLLVEAQTIVFGYSMMIDDAGAVVGHVAETDSKITDRNGITYDLSAQWVNSLDDDYWKFEVDNENWTWAPTDIRTQFEPGIEYEIKIEYQIDYAHQRSAIIAVTVDAVTMDKERFVCGTPSIPGRPEGWAPSEIVTQLQQCNNSRPGGYSLRFDKISYALSMP